MSYLERIKSSHSPQIAETPHQRNQAGPPTDSDVMKAIQRGAAVRVKSSVLGESVIWVRDESIKARIQARHPGAATYTLDELRKLIATKPDLETLRAIQNTKKILGGTLQLFNRNENNQQRLKEKNDEYHYGQ